MFKIWYQSMFSIFLLMLLVVNLLFFTNSVNTDFSLFMGSYENRYFGFNALYDFFTSGFVKDSEFLYNYYARLVELINFDMPYNLFGAWNDFSASGGVYSIETFFQAIGNFFRSFGAIFLYAFYPLMYMTYILCCIVWVLMKTFSLLNGGFFNDMPMFTYQ